MRQKFFLQSAIAIACLVPLSAGGMGMFYGVAMLEGGNINMDSHFRYLSGLLFAIGLGFLSCIPKIEKQSSRMRLLTGIVLIGGIARLAGLLINGAPGQSMLFGLVMELAITPGLYLWQRHIASRM